MSFAGILKAVKAAKLLLKKDNRKMIGKFMGIILSPFLLVVCLLTCMGDATTQHNQAVINTLFEDRAIPESLPLEFREYLVVMQGYFRKLDGQINEIQAHVKEGGLDPVQVKALFFSIYVNEAELNLKEEQLKTFVLCFTKDISKENIQNSNSEDDDTENIDEKRTLIVLSDINSIKVNVQTNMEIAISEETIENYRTIAAYVNPGLNAKTDGDGVSVSVQLQKIIDESGKKIYVGGTMRSPFVDDWREKVTSEFGHRDEIVLPDGTVTASAHTGLDMGAVKGTAIVAINDGEVVYVRNHQKGFGLHLVIDHGGGKLSIYAHTSKIIVKEGDKVKRGQKIAEVGSTGYSTGNHLHLEIWDNGKCQNPRSYLE